MNQPELLQKLSNLQNSLWPTVMTQVAEASGQYVQISSPLVLESQVAEILQEFAAPSVIIQFAFAGQRDSTQALLLPIDTGAALYVATTGKEELLTETNVEEIRAPLEAIVQGLCQALGNIRNETVVASDVSVRLNQFARPSSLQPTDALIRIQLAVSVGATIGSLTWLLDVPTSQFVSNVPEVARAGAAGFSPLPPFGTSRPVESESHGLDLLMDIPLDISVELGRTRMVVKEVVDLGVGSIVEIEKSAGEPVDIMVNGRLVARGEVVVIEDNFGVRITEILNPHERLARLGEVA